MVFAPRTHVVNVGSPLVTDDGRVSITTVARWGPRSRGLMHRPTVVW